MVPCKSKVKRAVPADRRGRPEGARGVLGQSSLATLGADEDDEDKHENERDYLLMETIPDGQLYWIILEGSDPEETEMEGYKDKLTQHETWAMVHFIRAFAQED